MSVGSGQYEPAAPQAESVDNASEDIAGVGRRSLAGLGSAPVISLTVGRKSINENLT